MCRSMADIRSTAAEIRRGKKRRKKKKKEEGKKLQGKNIMAPLLHRAAITNETHSKVHRAQHRHSHMLATRTWQWTWLKCKPTIHFLVFWQLLQIAYSYRPIWLGKSNSRNNAASILATLPIIGRLFRLQNGSPYAIRPLSVSHSVLSCLWRWCIVAKRLDVSRWNLACK